jgi:structural maintenance of chromosome 4
MDDARTRMDRPFDTPQGVLRLFDLITPLHDDFRPALYYATNNTLVAPDLDTAVQVGYSGRVNANIVTVTGKTFLYP